MLPSDFFSALSADSLILTPNRRLSNFVATQYNLWKQNQKHTVWIGFDIYPFTQWLQELWQNCLQVNTKLLTEGQSQFLWEKVIGKYSPNLLKIDSTAKQAMEAAKLITLWQIPLEEHIFSIQPDCQQFILWYKLYQDYCLKKNWIDNNGLVQTICNHFEDFLPQLARKNNIFLVGFDELPPLWSELLTNCVRFCKITHVDFKTTKTDTVRYEFDNFTDELLHAATWLRKEHQNNPDQRFACVIPNLSEQRVLIEKTFLKIFSTQKFMQLDDSSDLPYNISAGQPLNSFDIIATANEILNFEFEQNKVSLNIIRMLLRSPFIVGYYKEFGKRVNLEFKLMGLNSNQFELSFFLKLLMQYCPLLYVHVYKFLGHRLSKNHTLEEWLDYFNISLELLGWPGEKELSSQNFQLIQRYKETWNELLALNCFIETCSRKKATSLLIKLCETTLFQVKTGDKPIQILGTLEAAGIYFDKLWLMQANETLWPSISNPNPFIPHHIQKKYQLPHSSAEREWQFTKKLFHRFIHSATEFYVSSSRQKDNQEIACSFLIHDWPISCFEDKIYDPIKILRESQHIEKYYDKNSLAITKEELKNLKGGTDILKTQAECPFKAFAKFRLKATKSPLPQPGLTALQRGEIVHGSLELFWQRVQNLRNLKALSKTELEFILKECITASMLSIHPNLYKALAKLFQIEIKRLLRIFKTWLELELKRDNFHIYKLEESIQTEFLDLPLKLRIDRIDQLDSGALILIDYKTGEVSTNLWLDERIDEPQLPLYALIYPEQIDGIIFGQIKHNAFSMKGFTNPLLKSFQNSNSKDIAVNSSVDWNELKKNWQQNLAATAKGFLEGCADVDPKYGKQTCQFCELTSLCRIEELANATH